MGAKNHAVIMPDGKFVSILIPSSSHVITANINLTLNSIAGAAFGGNDSINCGLSNSTEN